MKHRTSWVAAGLIVAAAFTVSWSARRATARLHRETRAIDDRATRARAQMRAQLERVTTSNQELTRLQAELDGTRQIHAAVAASTVKSRPDWAAWFKTYETRKKDPKEQLRDLQLWRAQLQPKYAPLYRKLGLTPDKIAGFEANESRYTEMQNDLFAAITAEGLSWRDPEVAQLYDEARREDDDAQREMLGDQGYAQFKQYQRTLSAREVVRGLSAAATMSGVPLSGDQAEQLVQAFADADPEYRKGGTANLLSADWSKADAAAAQILSPQQRQILTDFEPPTGTGRHWSVLNRTFNDVVTAEMKKPAADPRP
jgi:hypothetical protein